MDATFRNEKTQPLAGFRHDGNTRPVGPAQSQGSGRRAREVMPDAMRAEVRTSALAVKCCTA